ncbi:MAG: polymerase subunit sigma-24 [Frankiales bacterium]|nr:polymerase subunit sigma-24 [Frankiales bacterium]
MTEAIARELVVLPPVADDPVFTEPLPEKTTPAPRTLGNDPHDFAALYMRHRWSFALHARRFLSDKRDIDEVVQEGFLKLFLAMPELETELQALAYARRTITNLCIDRYRADQRRPRLVDLESVRVDDLAEDDELDPVVAAEDAAIVREALALLSPLHREALIKREVEEKSLPQIAVELDLPVEQVKHVLHRARRSLRRLLVGTYVEPGVDLDLASVLAANRARAAAAAKPTGAAVIAILLVLAGVIGLRSHGNSRRQLEVAPSAQPGAILGGLPSGAPATPTRHVPSSSLPPAKAVQHHAAPPVTGQGSPAAPTSGSRKPTGTGGKPTTPSVPPTQPPVIPAAPVYVVTGVPGPSTAQVVDQQRDLRPAGTASTSTLTNGQYALRQSFTFDPEGSLTSVSANETLPAPQGSVATALGSSATNVEMLADGTIRLLTTGISQPADGSGPSHTLVLDVVLDSARVQVLSETVTVSDQVAAAPEATPSASPVTPEPAPTPSAPPPTPSAPPLLTSTSSSSAGRPPADGNPLGSAVAVVAGSLPNR